MADLYFRRTRLDRRFDHPPRRMAAPAATGSADGSGADHFSGGSGSDTATDFISAEGDTTDGKVP